MCANPTHVSSREDIYVTVLIFLQMPSTMLTMKHGFLITSVKMLQTAQNFPGLVTMHNKRIMGCHQMPLAWQQIIHHQVSSKVCSSNILLLFQASLFLLSSHIQAPSVHVSFQSKFFTFFFLLLHFSIAF